MDRARLKLLLEDYTLEEIVESCDVEVLDALEYLVSYGIIDLGKHETED